MMEASWLRLALMRDNLVVLPLNCPQYGRRMRIVYVRAADGRTVEVAIATDADIHVYQCAKHGRFHFVRDIPVRADA
jgi:hypothetical protein